MDNYKKSAEQKFEEGLFCAESVLEAVAEKLDIQSPLIPKIATGFCSGLARTSGMCGALTGGILGLNIAFGRNNPNETVEENYAAVQLLLKQFHEKYGAINCADLLGCDIGTEKGQNHFREKKLGSRCKEFTGISAELTISIIEARKS